jgi:hypothetical protein
MKPEAYAISHKNHIGLNVIKLCERVIGNLNILNGKDLRSLNAP